MAKIVGAAAGAATVLEAATVPGAATEARALNPLIAIREATAARPSGHPTAIREALATKAALTARRAAAGDRTVPIRIFSSLNSSSQIKRTRLKVRVTTRSCGPTTIRSATSDKETTVIREITATRISTNSKTEAQKIAS